MTSKKKKRMISLLFAAVLFSVLAIWISWGNTALEMNSYTIKSERIPEGFDGFRIAHVSDLHNAEMGEDHETLLAMLRRAEPDIIAITGDLIDSRHTDIDLALHFVKGAMEIAPLYYVTGNHESRVAEFDRLKEGLAELGVVLLEDERIEIERSGDVITLMGVNDPDFEVDYLFGDSKGVMEKKLQALLDAEDPYRVLLSHRPELFEVYANFGLDLVLSGHAHGGQFRLPFVGGLVAPNQGLFPKYDAGLYTEGNTNMIVSRGIGNSLFPFRFNNRPEVILIALAAGK